MNPKFIILMNHELTQQQEKEVRNRIGCRDIIYPPPDIKNTWMTIDPEGELNRRALQPIVGFISTAAYKDDYVLVQGEFGATFYIVDYCFKNGIIPVYATSVRKYNEKKDSSGAVERHHLFRHVQFRQYLQCKEEMAPLIDEKVHFFSETLRSRIGNDIRAIILFGSHARGDSSENSYYDFVIILKNRKKENIDYIRATEVAFLNRFNTLCASLIYDEREWEYMKQLPLGHNIEREGVQI